jgi:hypothetical protein
MSKKAMLREIFGLKREEGIGGCRKLQNEKVYSVHIFPTPSSVTTSRNQKWAGNVARK